MRRVNNKEIGNEPEEALLQLFMQLGLCLAGGSGLRYWRGVRSGWQGGLEGGLRLGFSCGLLGMCGGSAKHDGGEDDTAEG